MPTIAHQSRTLTSWTRTATAEGDACDSDDDNDGMPDDWEADNGLDPLQAFDAWFDADLDGVLNKDEYIAGSDPNVSQGPAQIVYPKEQIVTVPNLEASLSFFYDITDGFASGLILNIHYDSSLIESITVNPEGSGLIGTGRLDDEGDLDGDPLTDRIIRINWSNFGDSFLESDQELLQLDIKFRDLTSSFEAWSVPLRFSGEASDGYSLSAGSVYFSMTKDTDGDGVEDDLDAFPADATETTDSDADGVGDNSDAFPDDPSEWLDSDGDATGNNKDDDDDGDGVADVDDDFPLDATEQTDTDGDGIGNYADQDDDDDGVPDVGDAYPLISLQGLTDSDGDGRPDGCGSACGAGMLADSDDDNDGVLDVDDTYPLISLQGLTDSDGDGIPNDCDSSCVSNGMNADPDDDGDGVLDQDDAFALNAAESLDTDADGVGNNSDLDDDGDGVGDANDPFPLDATEYLDTDSDGIGNNADTDDDNDGVDDIDDAYPLDPELSDLAPPDDDNDGQSNADEINCGSDPDDADSLSADQDQDLIPDCKDDDDDNDGVIDLLDFYPLDESRSDFGGQRALIVSGGGPYRSNFLWPATKNMANYAYKALRFQGLTDQDIVYLSEEDRPEVDGAPSLDSIVTAIAELVTDNAEASEVLIYFVDHGGDGVFKVNESLLITAETVRQALDELQERTTVDITFVYDACQSGSFLPLLANSAYQRVVIASAGPTEPAVFAMNGYTSFSFFFWSSFFVGAGISESTNIAKNSMGLLFSQSVLVDADGDGKANSKKDQSSFRAISFGQGALQASDFPKIGTIDVQAELNGEETIEILVEGVSGSTLVTQVSVYIESPDRYWSASDQPVLNVNRQRLSKQSEGIWAGTLEGFEVRGTYHFTIVAENSAGLSSLANSEEVSTVAVVQKSGREPFIEGDADEDGVGDLTDLDDDNDGINDSDDAFPIDATESLDTDSDGVGNNADRDDDNDGVLDDADAFALISLGSLTDTDGDGRPNDCDEDCLATGMTADSDDDNDGVEDTSDAFPLRC